MFEVLPYLLLFVPGVICVALAAVATSTARRPATRAAWIALSLSGLTVAILMALFHLLRHTPPFSIIDRLSGETLMILACAGMGIAQAICLRRVVRSIAVLPFVLLAAPASMWLCIWIEASPHGSWYRRNEGTALTLSFVASYVSYALLVGVPLLLWAYRVRRLYPPHACPTCGYDLRGLTTGPCPECGILPHKTATLR